ncbi:hypothetical protein BLNAU_12836 [Blattamonas nauphoetae]|uniref:Uncharacterized protein n=1 Tax=Blattamonas nauphoetae TaxID=2049346 RepID=A0ABQ9XLM5_9EUKA|nr:hypothetical protein BLNAU_12836 [Blattamonas nauphoetae]
MALHDTQVQQVILLIASQQDGIELQTVDIWAMGCIMGNLLDGQPMFHCCELPTTTHRMASLAKVLFTAMLIAPYEASECLFHVHYISTLISTILLWILHEPELDEGLGV